MSRDIRRLIASGIASKQPESGTFGGPYALCIRTTFCLWGIRMSSALFES
jgi:hypothetical protein